MRKSSKKIVSLMVAASMMFTTVMANSSIVASADEVTFPIVAETTNMSVPLGKTFAENENIDITVQYQTGTRTGGGGILVLQTPALDGVNVTDSNYKVKCNKEGTALSFDFDTAETPATVAVNAGAPNTIRMTLDRATGAATLTNVATNESISVTLADITKDAAKGTDKTVVALKADKGKGIVTINMIQCGSGADAVISGSAIDVTPTEPTTEATSEAASEESTEATTAEATTEAPTETTTEATVAIDLGTYDPASTGTQVRVEVNGEYGTAKVKTGDEITANFILSGNTGFNSYEALIAYDPAFVEFVGAVKPANSAEKDDFITYVNKDDDTKYAISFGLINDQNTVSANAGKLGIIKLSAAYDDFTAESNAAGVTGNGILAQVKFKVIGTEGAGYIAWLKGELNGETAEGFGNTETGLLNCNYTGTKLVLGSSEESTEASTEATTSSDVTEATTETTTATTEETTETTTKRHSSGGGGGSSSSNAAKENNSKADSTVGSITAQGNKTDSSKSDSTTSTKPSAVQTSVGATETPSGITINPPALKNADGEIVAGSALNSSSLVATNNFNDMATRAWAQDAVNKLSSIGVINGVGEGKFAPDATSKRGDFMVMLTKVLGVTGTPSTSFADVPANKYYANAVNLAKDLGLANGVGDNKFNPEAPITRQDMMVLTAKALEVVGYDVTSTDVSVLDKYADSNKIAEYAKPYVAFLIENGLVNGTSNTTVDPTANMTRAQMAVLMSNLYDLITDAVLEAQDEAVEEEVTEETEATDEEATEATEEVTEESEDAADEEAAADETEETEIEAEK